MKTVIGKIKKNIWLYLVWILAVCIFWSWLFGMLTQVTKEEKIVVFIGSGSLSFDRYDELNKARPEYILELELNVHTTAEKNFSESLNIFGIGESDILILPESYLQNESTEVVYAEISAAYCSLLPNLGTLERNGKVYGLKIHDKETHESLISCLDYGEGDGEENYYILFNRKSMHLGELSSSEGASERDGAIVIARRLLSL